MPGQTGRNHVIRKVARLLLLIRGRQRMPDPYWLASQLECSVRTVYRYVQAVEEAGWPMPARWRGEW